MLGSGPIGTGSVGVGFAAAPGGTSLSVGASTQSQVPSVAGLASASFITPASAAEGQAAATPGLVFKATLTVAAATHAQATTVPGLSAKSSLVPAGASHAQYATSAALSFRTALVPADASQPDVATVAGLSSRTSLTPADVVQAHIVSVPILAFKSILLVDAASHAQAAPGAFLTNASSTLPVDASYHAQAASGAILTFTALLRLASPGFIVTAEARLFSVVAEPRSFSITAKAKCMRRFAPKHPREIVFPEVDMSPFLADGEKPIGTPTVATTFGDVVVDSAVFDGTWVKFRMSGGTTAAALDHLIRVECMTDAGQTRDQFVTVPVRES